MRDSKVYCPCLDDVRQELSIAEASIAYNAVASGTGDSTVRPSMMVPCCLELVKFSFTALLRGCRELCVCRGMAQAFERLFDRYGAELMSIVGFKILPFWETREIQSTIEILALGDACQ